MDLIIPLPEVERSFDSIFIVVDKLTKISHLIPTQTTASTLDIAIFFFKEIVRLHGVPTRIISD